MSFMKFSDGVKFRVKLGSPFSAVTLGFIARSASNLLFSSLMALK